MVDVFISYRRAERDKVEVIKNKLEKLGLQVFFDVLGIDGGDDFPTVIDANLRTAKAVLACWSPLYFERRPAPDWCMIECRYALTRRKLVPIAIERIESDTTPVDMHSVNYLDLTAWRGQEEHEGWQRTLATLSHHLGRGLTIPQQGTRPPPLPRVPAEDLICAVCDGLVKFAAEFPPQTKTLGDVVNFLIGLESVRVQMERIASTIQQRKSGGERHQIALPLDDKDPDLTLADLAVIVAEVVRRISVVAPQPTGVYEPVFVGTSYRFPALQS